MLDEKVFRAERWAELRFAIIGPLLAAPPGEGELRRALADLAARTWRHPIHGKPVQFAPRTVERWFYRARDGRGSVVQLLRKKARKDRGEQRALSSAQQGLLREAYTAHPSWTVKLHYDNLLTRIVSDPKLGMAPSYASVRRFMRRSELRRVPRVPAAAPTAGQLAARQRLESREVRSYEVTHVGGLWHLDFHHGSLKVLLRSGEWKTPILLGIIDDYSRLVCHLQWYLSDGEGAEQLVHGLSQAILKRDLPRALMTDGGAPMIAAETRAGLLRLGIHHEQTLPYSPYQNGKIEAFWRVVEARLLAMLEGVGDLNVELLNRATQAWVEQEYNVAVHSETGLTPRQRFLDGESVLRKSPPPEDLRLAFRRTVSRSQRKGDGTVSIAGRRFEVPSRYRGIRRIHVSYAQWDLTRVYLVNLEEDRLLATLRPLDKGENASGKRRTLAKNGPGEAPVPPKSGIAPRLEQLMAAYALSGLPPAYLPTAEPGPEEA